MRQILLIGIMMLLIIPVAFALNECKGIIFPTDSPCLLLLPHNTSATPCSFNVSIYSNGSRLVTSKIMGNFTSFLCNATFDQKSLGTYTFFYDSGDSGSITVIQDLNPLYYIYIILFAFFVFLMWLGYHKEDPMPLTIAGFLMGVIGVSILFGNFPNLTDTFLQETIGILLLGIAFFLMVAPNVDEIARMF